MANLLGDVWHPVGPDEKMQDWFVNGGVAVSYQVNFHDKSVWHIWPIGTLLQFLCTSSWTANNLSHKKVLAQRGRLQLPKATPYKLLRVNPSDGMLFVW